MKKSLISALMLCVGIMVYATAAMSLLAGVSAQAANPKDVRIYINPGHGSWGPNNRHMATIGHNPISTTDPDTTDFLSQIPTCASVLNCLKDFTNMVCLLTKQRTKPTKILLA